MPPSINKKILLTCCVIAVALLTYCLYPGEKIPDGVVINKLVVWKSQRKLQAFSGDRLVISYPIALGKDPVGAKKYEGDNKTPEGNYVIFDKTIHSRYHKNLGISYPNDADKANALKLGKPTGGEIKIHGLQNGMGFIGRLHTLSDWTAGCIALTNQEIDDLYDHMPIGTTIEIRP